MRNTALMLSKNFPRLLIGLRAKWEPGGFKYYKKGMPWYFEEKERVS